MIVFDLRCDGGHVFEAWFASSAAYEDQRARRLISCPLCEDKQIEKAVMAPRVAAKGNCGPSASEAKALMTALAQAQKQALAGSKWVGNGFATQARAMHLGEQTHQVIHGQATPLEAKSLAEDGVPVQPLLFPVVPPEANN